jgi:hypothetical protein
MATVSISMSVSAKPPQLALSRAAALPAVITPNGSWTTYHHDDGRTGYDPAAPTVGTVSPTPGWTQPTLDAEVYAEPLIYNGLVYVATLNNTVYALNQSDGSIVWQMPLGAPETTGWGCGNVSPQGILGTPVIDTAASRIYVATLFADDIYRVFGLDLATGATRLTTQIPATIGTGFDWTIQQQRGALSLRNGYVYVPFGGRAGDCGTYHGFVVGVPTNGSTTLAVYQTPSSGSGIWTAGGVVVDDSTGNVFAATGNGVASGCATVDQNDAVVRLSPSLVLQDYFMPQDWQAHWCSNDQDLGSASPLLISPNLLFQSGKWGGGFLMNPNSLGQVDGQLFPTPKPATYSQADVCFGNTSDATFGSFAYAAPFIYVECEGRGLVALSTNTSTPSFSPCDAACAAPDWHAGAITFGPPIVAGGAVWVANNGGGLYAFNATTGVQIYHSAGFGINRFVTPAEAGGQVFVPSHTVIKSFTFAAPPPPPPSVVSLTPNNGPTAGGTSVTIAGTNFTGATAVKFGAAAAASFSVNSATQVTATSPSGSGIVDITVTAPSGTSVISAADRFAYTTPPVGYAALGPTRVMDTRDGTGGVPVAPLGPGGIVTLTVAGVGPVPAGATAVVLNVTVTNTTAASFLTVYPAGGSLPLASNLNWTAGKTLPNLVSVQVGAGGAVTFYNAFGSTDVVADLEGFFSANLSREVALTPARITDTRPGSGLPNAGSTLGAGGSLDIQVENVGLVPPTGVSAAVLNVTVTDTTAASYLTVWAAGAAQPLASNLNWTPGLTVPNRVIVPLSASGRITVFNKFGSADVVVDVSGYFQAATSGGQFFTPLTPFRIEDTRTDGKTLSSNSSFNLQVGGANGVPSTASAVVLNVTVTNTTAPSFLTVWPATSSRPQASDLNWTAGVIVPNLVVATVGTTGAITFYNSAGSTDVVVDLLGWFN